MRFEDLNVKFQGMAPYVFYFENVHLLMLNFDRDDVKFLYRIADQSGTDITLDYPGETFVERVLDSISNIFFIQLQEGENQEPRRYVLGSYFEFNGAFYGAYYQHETEPPDVVLFRLNGEAPEHELEPIEGTEYEQAAAYFLENYT